MAEGKQRRPRINPAGVIISIVFLLVSVSALADSTRWLFTADAKWVLTGLIALVGVVLVVTALPGNRRD